MGEELLHSIPPPSPLASLSEMRFDIISGEDVANAVQVEVVE